MLKFLKNNDPKYTFDPQNANIMCKAKFFINKKHNFVKP